MIPLADVRRTVYTVMRFPRTHSIIAHSFTGRSLKNRSHLFTVLSIVADSDLRRPMQIFRK